MNADPARPSPLTPPDCDLSGYDWFPLKHKRLLRSAWWLRASDRAKALNFELWCAAYQETPAASLPDDDLALSDMVGFGRRDLTAWLAVKDEVMAPWTLCSDGRWYHPTLAEVANDAWASRQEALKAREAERERKRQARGSGGKGDMSAGHEALSGGRPADTGRTSGAEAADTDRTSGGFPPENALKGQDRTGEEKGEADASPSDARCAPEGGLKAEFDRLRKLYADIAPGRGSPRKAEEAFAALTPDDRAALVGAARRYGETRPWGSNGPVGLERFIADDIWRDFAVTASVTDIVWRGPADLRAAVVAETSEAFARSYLDPAEWRDPRHDRQMAVIALTPLAAAKLRPLKAMAQVAIQDPILPRRTA